MRKIFSSYTPCWIWPYGTNSAGYGAYRKIFELFEGPVPKGLELDHLCRNRLCVNPTHLEPVTRAVNAQRGKNAKLTMNKAREIRKLYGDSDISQYKIAAMFNVGQKLVCNIINNKTWKE